MLTHITIATIQGTQLITGYYSSHAHCLGEGVARGISLAGADLSRLDLRAAELDEADLRGARLTGANLAGANMSDSDLRGCDFTHANLADSCMAYADLRHCDLYYCRIGATDITGARLDNARLAGPDSFALPFASCASMQHCVYYDEDRTAYTLHRPPVVVTGLPEPVVIMEQGIKYGAGLVRPVPLTPDTNRDHICREHTCMS